MRGEMTMVLSQHRPAFLPSLRPQQQRRTIQLPPRRAIADHEITETFLKGSGPGGQKINKTSSAVQLKHLPTGLVVKSQATRSRSQNRKIARRILGEQLEVRELGDASRVKIKADTMRKKKASASKKARRKIRKVKGEKLLPGPQGVEEDGDARHDRGDEARVEIDEEIPAHRAEPPEHEVEINSSIDLTDRKIP
ncbi:MAG: hypothetical protein M1838_003270 [Thelocarpon superellum]|nr:MAG: hypothetical protein M1838_003270 [Thelocarpon superellum]